MIVTLVHVWVKPECVVEFLKATIENHEKSIHEIGNLRFDILQDDSNKNKFVLYEAYESDAAVITHKATEHYLKWRDVVADMMAKPRKGERHIVIRPIDSSLW